jgi:hypothetical protein
MKFNHRSLRDHIALEAARLLYERQETEYPRAKRRAARSIGVRFRPDQLPSNREVRDQLRQIETTMNASSVAIDPRTLLLEAIRLMRLLKREEPRLEIPPSESPALDTKVLLHVAGPPTEDIRSKLTRDRLSFDTLPEEPPWLARFVCTSLPLAILFQDLVPTEATIDLATAEALVSGDSQTRDVDAEMEGLDPDIDRFEIYEELLKPLEDIRQDPRVHPEGDVLYHSLQVFELALQEYSFDEEFLTAALLHDVGKSINADDPVTAADPLLRGVVTHRTRWLIEHLPLAKPYLTRQLPPEKRQEIEGSENFEDLLRLHELDTLGRQCGAETRTVAEAIDMLRDLDQAAL